MTPLHLKGKASTVEQDRILLEAPATEPRQSKDLHALQASAHK